MLLAALYSNINGRYINPAIVGLRINRMISANPLSRIFNPPYYLTKIILTQAVSHGQYIIHYCTIIIYISMICIIGITIVYATRNRYIII